MGGMDQAKFRCPRQLSLSKEFQSCRRPELHATGAVVDGLLESYWLSDCSVPKNANLQLTLLSRVLQQSADILAKSGRGLPAVLRAHTDNATSEGKNQTVMKYMAWLVWKRTFRACEMTMFRVGRTHNKQDQRFGEVAAALARKQELEVAWRYQAP